MKSLEQSGSTTSRVQLYFKLGKLLERELDRLRTKKDTSGLKQDAAGLPGVSHGAHREPVRADLRVAAMGR